MEVSSLGPVASNCGIEKQDFIQFLEKGMPSIQCHSNTWKQEIICPLAHRSMQVTRAKEPNIVTLPQQLNYDRSTSSNMQ